MLRAAIVAPIFALFSPCVHALESDVLIIHSYDQHFQWTENITWGLEDVFEQEPEVTLHSEYMDTKRYPLEQIETPFFAFISAKYRDRKIDLVIVSDNNAFSTVLKRGESLFPGAPIVFCGVNEFTSSMLAGHQNVTGVVEDVDITKTIQTILRIQPGVRHLAAVSDDVPTARIHRRQLAAAFALFRRRLELIELYNLSADSLKVRLAALPAQTAILHLSLYRDARGVRYSGNEGFRLVVENADAPVYCLWDIWVGEGAVGGVVTSGYEQGKSAGLMARRILAGTAAASIPVKRESPNAPMFDYVQLAKHDLRFQALPPGAVIINRKQSFYQRHKQVIWAATVLIGILGVFIAALSASVLRRRRAEAELRRNNDLLSSVLSSIPHYVYWKDRNGRYQGCNDNFARAVGTGARSAITGKTDRELPWPDTEKSARERADAAVLASGEQQVGLEEQIAFPARSIVSLSARVPLHNAEGLVNGVLGMYFDITERKRLQREIAQAQRLEALGLLAGGIAHDFNNMLAGITSAADLLMARTADSAVEEYTRIILDSSQKAAGLIQRLLTSSQRRDVEPVSVDMHQLILDSLSVVSRGLDQRLRLETDLQATDARVAGDPGRLQNAIINLAINARDAMPEGGVLTIATRLVTLDRDQCRKTGFNVRPGQYLRIIVRDTGKGMTEQVRERLFEPFYTTKEMGGGAGLGLSGVYTIVKDHHGAIMVNSAAGEGAVVELLLPSEPPQQAPEPPQPSRAVFGRGRILVVDDEEVVRESTQFILEGLGYEVATAQDGIAALELFRGQADSFDLVLLDMVMPRMNGEDCFIALRKIRPDIRVVASSGYTPRMGNEDYKSRGFIASIAKPYRRGELSQVIASAMRTKPESGAG